MKPGPSLDLLVEEKVMGRCVHEIPFLPTVGTRYQCQKCGDTFGKCSVALARSNPPRYSTDIAAAWKVLERLLPDHGDVEVSSITSHDENEWVAKLQCSSAECCDIIEAGVTAPHAICLAALSAVGAIYPAG